MHVLGACERRESGEAGDHAVGREVETMMSEAGKDVMIPDLWRMSALCEICPRDVKEQMMMRLDEIGESVKAKLVCTRPTRPSKHEEGRKRCVCRWRWAT